MVMFVSMGVVVFVTPGVVISGRVVMSMPMIVSSGMFVLVGMVVPVIIRMSMGVLPTPRPMTR